ncbi:MAG: glycine--tRNA ligase subunit beta [Bacillota bacterium]|nr:glycine--tRNA ligase subunit beta [Bacillota bacterium]
MIDRDLILEIGTEEIPARFMPEGLKQLQRTAGELFKEQGLVFREILTFGTPRRLVMFVRELTEKQPDREEQVKGPSKKAAFDDMGKPTKAGLGFAARIGIPLEEIGIESSDKGEYLLAVRKIPGKKTMDVLQSLLPFLIKSIAFPKNMFWEGSRTKFARPIRWLLCIYGVEEVPFSYAGLKSGNKTMGHRLLSPGPLTVRDPGHYFECMEESKVIVDQNRRAKVIEEGVQAAALSQKVRALIDSDLLEEVTFLVEHPEPVLCSFPEEYLQLPREVLVTTMQSHQRYFPVENTDGELCPYFITVSNNSAAALSNVRSGNEKVLKARLADARFFYQEDLKTTLEQKVEKLKYILFQEELGTIFEKTQRLIKISEYLTDHFSGLSEAEKKAALRAAYLSKADLSTNMVGEFPELQGVMGKEYALRSGESEDAAKAVYEHYLPRFAGDKLPGSKPGAIAAIADKADHLAGCFAIGIRPTGSQDPYALRRQSLGLLQILLEHKVSLSFSELMKFTLSLYKEKEQLIDLQDDEIIGHIKDFAWQRLRYLFQERGIDYDVVDAVMSSPLEEIASLWARIKFLQENRKSVLLESAAAAYNRVANLARQADSDLEPDKKLFSEKGEENLYHSYLSAKKKVLDAIGRDDLEETLAQLADLKEPLDNFFIEVLVMVDDKAVRSNRLALLLAIKNLYLELADFSKIVFPAHS